LNFQKFESCLNVGFILKLHRSGLFVAMGATHGKDESQTSPSRAGFRFGKGMDVREDGSEFIFTAEAQRPQSLRRDLFF
jgi:hypothetical protein